MRRPQLMLYIYDSFWGNILVEGPDKLEVLTSLKIVKNLINNYQYPLYFRLRIIDKDDLSKFRKLTTEEEMELL